MTAPSPGTGETIPVDLVINCFERTYREVLAPGTFDRIAGQNRRRFAARTALVNNVDDRADAQARADRLIAAGEISRVVFVADRLDHALARTGLDRPDLEPASWHVDWALVAVTLDGPEWMLHWDADVRLREPADWVGPALELMERDRRVLIANPNWEDPTLERFTSETMGPFALGHGFSDQVFLGRRTELGAPIYRQRCLARWRYPFPDSFEARVDAYLRHAGRLRATYRDVVYEHPVTMGTSWPDRSLRDRAAAARRHLTIRALAALPWRPQHLRQL
jgi:hypothetical protein